VSRGANVGGASVEAQVSEAQKGRRKCRIIVGEYTLLELRRAYELLTLKLTYRSDYDCTRTMCKYK
jgi:hypothetical protein